MENKTMLLHIPVEYRNNLKKQAVNLTDKEIPVNYNMSSLLENCVLDLLECGIDKKDRAVINKAEMKFKISEPIYLKLKALSIESGFTMTELIIKAYERFNPDINSAYDHLR